MARTRSIKPGFFDNEILGDLEPLTRLLFIGLWTIADREGRLEDKPRRIKKILLGYDDVDASEVDKMLQDLHNSEFILRYQVDDTPYILINNFTKHQNPHIREKDSEIPPPEAANMPSTIQAPCENCAGTIQATPITGTLSPSTDYLSPTTADEGDGEGKQSGESLTVETAGTTAGKETREQSSKTLIEKRFDEFWAAYPKKVGKKAALSSWKKLKPTAELHDKIMTAVGRARVTEQWLRENGRYIPNPTTWINQGRWDDEYEEGVTNGVNSQYSSGNKQQPTAPAQGASGKQDALAGFKTID